MRFSELQGTGSPSRPPGPEPSPSRGTEGCDGLPVSLPPMSVLTGRLACDRSLEVVGLEEGESETQVGGCRW